MKYPRRFAAALLSAALAVLLTAPVLADDNIVDPYRLYTYEQMVSDVNTLAERYPELITVSSIGKSAEGRELVCFTLGRGERAVILCAAMHAREYVSANFIMYMAEGYARGYAENGIYDGMGYRELLDRVRLVIVPMVNPDGVTLAQTGAASGDSAGSIAAMPVTDAESSGLFGWKANINGVDLNHNFPYLWNENPDVPAPASANYNGPAPGSEPETRALLGLLGGTQFYMLCSFHTSGQCVYWIDSSNSAGLYSRLQPIAKRISRGIGYTLCPVEDVSKFGGYLVNYARAEYERPCFTVELCPYYSSYPYGSYPGLESTLEKVYPIGLLLAKEAAAMEELPKPVKVVLLGETVRFDGQRPVILRDRALVPVRAVAEECGLDVDWNEITGSVIVTGGSTGVELTIGSPQLTVNGQTHMMDCVPQIIGGRAMLPIRYVLEAFGYAVGWDAEDNAVIVSRRLS